MSLIDELRETLDHLPPSHFPTGGETARLVGALVGYVEHGDKFLRAAAEGGFDELAKLFGPVEEEQPQADASQPQAEEAAQRQQAAFAQAVSQQTQPGPVEPT